MSPNTPAPPTADADHGHSRSLRNLVAPYLGIDPRALGAFRIALGLLVLVDLMGYRLPELRTFYTDDGVYPRALLESEYPLFAELSLHALSGSLWPQLVLIALAGVAAVSLLVGYRTRLATVVSIVLLASLQARNPHVLNGGDTVLLTLLVFGAFLPLGARWGLESGRCDDGDERVVSAPTAATLLTIVLLYTTNGILKFESDPWMDGIAVQQIAHLEQYLIGLGPLLGEFSSALLVANWLWIALLCGSGLLVLTTGWVRAGVVAAFVVAHLGLAVTMHLGVFPFVMIAAVALFLPPRVWDRVERTLAGVVERVADTDDRKQPPSEPESTSSSTSGGRHRRRVATVVVLSLFLVLSLWQVTALGFAEDSALEIDAVEDASWSFFAPNPPSSHSWLVADARLESGERVDPIRGGDPAIAEPPDTGETYSSPLWKRYGTTVPAFGENHDEALTAYVCQSDDAIETVTISLVDRPVDADGPTDEPTVSERLEFEC